MHATTTIRRFRAAGLAAACTAAVAGAALLGGCAGDPAPADGTMTREQAQELFQSRGPQPGHQLPALHLVDLDGAPADLAAIQKGRPMVLVTASLTCNVARRTQPQLEELRRRFGDQVAVVVVYTLEAHPAQDPCPYTGKEWVPESNKKDGVLVRQPTGLTGRLALAREFQSRYAPGTTVLVDLMDDAAWKSLGQAPNLGLLVVGHGMVRMRQGWFDADAMTKELIAIGVKPLPTAPAR